MRGDGVKEDNLEACCGLVWALGLYLPAMIVLFVGAWKLAFMVMRW